MDTHSRRFHSWAARLRSQATMSSRVGKCQAQQRGGRTGGLSFEATPPRLAPRQLLSPRCLFQLHSYTGGIHGCYRYRQEQSRGRWAAAW